jgi:hypothetical protein
MKPDSDLAGSGASHIVRTFVVSEEDARRIAADYVRLIGGNGGDVARFTPQRFADLLTKALCRKYSWRDPVEKATWERAQNSVAEGYNAWIEASRRSPFNSWEP